MPRYQPTEFNGRNPDAPPHTVSMLVDEIKRHKTLPDEIPRDYLRAATWWIAHQRPVNKRTERPTAAPVIGREDGKRWLTPYADRLIASFRMFITLSDEQRPVVLKSAQDMIWYNGEDFEVFKRILEETKRAREQPEAYREESIKGLRRVIRRIAG